MTASARIERKGYCAAQIALHWVIAILIVCQFVFHESMVDAWRALRRGGDAAAPVSLAAQTHVWGGLAVLAFALWRLWLRQTRGVPAAPAEEAAPLRLAAHITHGTLYALMILMPLTGAAAWFGGIGAASEAHEILRIPLFFLVLIHLFGALFQHFWLKTSVLNRIVRPER
jgi:cytochrome b561